MEPTRSPLRALLLLYCQVVDSLVWHAAIVEPTCLRFSKTCHDCWVLSNRRKSLRCVEALTSIPPLKGLKWNESGFRPPLCTYRLNWARRTSWGWWDDWDDTVLQTQNSKFEPWRSEAEHATSRSRRLPTILTFTRGWGRNIFCFLQTAETGNRTPDSGVKGSGANPYPRAPALKGLKYYICDRL